MTVTGNRRARRSADPDPLRSIGPRTNISPEIMHRSNDLLGTEHTMCAICGVPDILPTPNDIAILLRASNDGFRGCEVAAPRAQHPSLVFPWRTVHTSYQIRLQNGKDAATLVSPGPGTHASLYGFVWVQNLVSEPAIAECLCFMAGVESSADSCTGDGEPAATGPSCPSLAISIGCHV